MNRVPIETRIFDHVVGSHCPLEDLLQKGILSSEWAARYLELLAEAKDKWLGEAHWPRELVAAVHMSSLVLDSRYRGWSGLDKSQRNLKTEELLAAITSKSHFFLNAPVLERGRLGK